MGRFIIIISFSILLSTELFSTELWSGYGTGTNDDIFAIASSENFIYAGGIFTIAGGEPAGGIARWDKMNSTWLPLGLGVAGNFPEVFVTSIIVIGTDVYVAGKFTLAGGDSTNNIAKWDEVTETWSTLGEGADDFIASMVLLDDNIYMVGSFLNAGGKTVNMFAKYNVTTEQWDSLGTGISETVSDSVIVTSITVNENNIYVGGNFSVVGGVDANNIAMWDLNTSTWSPLIDNSAAEPVNGVDNAVLTFEWYEGMLYAGGFFQNAGPLAANLIAMWDGSKWNTVGENFPGGFGHQINDILVLDEERIFIGVMETLSNDGSVRKLNGADWVKVDGFDPLGGVQALYLHENHIIVGGRFGELFGNPVGEYQFIAKFEDPDNPYAYSKLTLKSFLEGPYESGSLNSSLNSAGILPVEQPFNVEPWNYLGTEQVSAEDIEPANGIPDFYDNNPNIVDWILIEIRSAMGPESIVQQKACFILNDGTIVNHDGSSPLNLNNFGEYYVILHHKNHLPIMSSTKVQLK